MTEQRSLKWSVVIPAKNEQKHLPALLTQLQPAQARGAQIIVVDGGSTDNTVSLIEHRVDQLIVSQPGRAKQMQLGVNAAAGEMIIFLHADSVLPANFADILQAIDSNKTPTLWGRFDVRLNSRSILLGLVGWMISWRSRWSGIATGDQGIFVRNSFLQTVGGIPQLPLMEDVELSRRLKQVNAPLCLHDKIITSARKWQKEGPWRTIVLMWSLRFAYFVGIKPERLAQRYYR